MTTSRDHDGTYRKLFEDPVVFEEFLDTFVDLDIIAKLDLSAPRAMDTAFMDDLMSLFFRFEQYKKLEEFPPLIDELIEKLEEERYTDTLRRGVAVKRAVRQPLSLIQRNNASSYSNSSRSSSARTDKEKPVSRTSLWRRSRSSCSPSSPPRTSHSSLFNIRTTHQLSSEHVRSRQGEGQSEHELSSCEGSSCASRCARRWPDAAWCLQEATSSRT